MLSLQNKISLILPSTMGAETSRKPPQVSTEAVKEPPQELNEVEGVNCKNDDSDKVICEVNAVIISIDCNV